MFAIIQVGLVDSWKSCDDCTGRIGTFVEELLCWSSVKLEESDLLD